MVQKRNWFRVRACETEILGTAPLATGILLEQICFSQSVLSGIAKVSVRQGIHKHRWIRDTLQKKPAGVAAGPQYSSGKPLQSTHKNSMATSQSAILARRT